MPRGKRNTGLSVRSSGALSTKAPSYIKEGSRGIGKLKPGAVSVPFLKLAQDKTPQVLSGVVDKGHWFNNVTNEDFGESVEIIVLAAWTGQMLFGDYNKKEGILCQAPDGEHALAPGGKDARGKATDACAECVLKDWKGKGKSAEPPECMQQGKFVVIVKGQRTPMYLVLQSTNFPAARKLNTILVGGGADTFAQVIKLSHHKGDKSELVGVSLVGWASEEDYTTAEKLFATAAKSLMGQQLDSVSATD